MMPTLYRFTMRTWCGSPAQRRPVKGGPARFVKDKQGLAVRSTGDLGPPGTSSHRARRFFLSEKDRPFDSWDRKPFLSRSIAMKSSRLGYVVLALACLGGPLGAATITLSGQVYDGHGGPLLKGNVYHVLGQVEVPVGETLSAEEGVIVKFSANVGLTVNGALSFQGTDLERIVFTSIHDDTAGGDTNQNGGATNPQPGDWRGLFFSFNSGPSTVTWSDIRWAGTALNSGAIELHGTTVVFDHLRFS